MIASQPNTETCNFYSNVIFVYGCSYVSFDDVVIVTSPHRLHIHSYDPIEKKEGKRKPWTLAQKKARNKKNKAASKARTKQRKRKKELQRQFAAKMRKLNK